jgi:hypothetical protein
MSAMVRGCGAGVSSCRQQARWLGSTGGWFAAVYRSIDAIPSPFRPHCPLESASRWVAVLIGARVACLVHSVCFWTFCRTHCIHPPTPTPLEASTQLNQLDMAGMGTHTSAWTSPRTTTAAGETFRHCAVHALCRRPRHMVMGKLEDPQCPTPPPVPLIALAGHLTVRLVSRKDATPLLSQVGSWRRQPGRPGLRSVHSLPSAPRVWGGAAFNVHISCILVLLLTLSPALCSPPSAGIRQAGQTLCVVAPWAAARPAAEDVLPCTAIIIRAPCGAYLPPACRPGASTAILAGTCLVRPAIPVDQLASLLPPPPPPPYKLPQHRTPAEQAAAAEAGRPGRPCAFPAMTAGPLPLSVIAVQPPRYRLALQG